MGCTGSDLRKNEVRAAGPAEKLAQEGMVLLKERGRKAAVNTAGSGHLLRAGRMRLVRELFSGRFRPKQSVELGEIATEYKLDNESVLKVFAEFQALGMVRLSENFSAIVRSRHPEETQEAYEIWAAIEEIAGRIAASVLKGYTAELQSELVAMRAAVAGGDLDAYVEHDVKFHRCIIKAAQNDVLLRVWDALAIDLRICAMVRRIPKDVP
jgi:DNA-binding GntR family transcriptional regulator